MGLRCLIGHDFGAPETTREREERGDEVLVTVREFRECRRCGHQHVISENKEVKAGGPQAPQPEAPPEDRSIDRDPPDEEPIEPMTSDTDDGVILEDEPEESGGRGYGEWPETDEEDDEPESPTTAWPSHHSDDEGYKAEAPEEGPAGGVEFGGGLTPEATAELDASVEDDAEVVERTEAGPGTGITSVSPGPDPTRKQRLDDPDTEYHCPECDYTVASSASSLRPGDICPECRKGYLAERAAQGRNP